MLLLTKAIFLNHNIDSMNSLTTRRNPQEDRLRWPPSLDRMALDFTIWHGFPVSGWRLFTGEKGKPFTFANLIDRFRVL
jgi:hypothetical protein